MKKLHILFLGILLGAIPTAFATASLFSDVNEGDWYYDAVVNLQEKGIIEGYEDDTYKPASDVNRAELAVIIDRLMEVTRGGCIYEDKFYFNGDIISETDVEEYSCQNGIVEGVTWDEF
ncbi:MAG: S-layer homology domain-containing protein [Candidatus Gracilibacteria bacterium]